MGEGANFVAVGGSEERNRVWELSCSFGQYTDAGYARLCTATPAWKDTVLVPGMGSVTLLVPVLNYTGMACSTATSSSMRISA